MTVLGPDNAFWADGEWISWEEFGEEVVEHGGHLAELEREAAMRWRFPNADIVARAVFCGPPRPRARLPSNRLAGISMPMATSESYSEP